MQRHSFGLHPMANGDIVREDLAAADRRARDGYRFRKCPGPDVIEPTLSADEEVLQLLRCQIGTKAATIVLTTQRVHTFAKGNFFGGLVAADEVIPIPMITGVERSRELMNEWGLTITRAANVDSFIYCDESESAEFVSRVRELIHAAQSGTQTVIQNSQPDPLDQLKKLKDLHDAGIISDAEFAEKKTRLMDQI